MQIELLVDENEVLMVHQAVSSDAVHNLTAVLAIALQNSGYQVVIRNAATKN